MRHPVRSSAIAQIIRTYVIDGRPYVDAWIPGSAIVYKKIQVLVLGGSESFLYMAPQGGKVKDSQIPFDPQDTDRPQALVFFSGSLPMAAFCLSHPTMDLKEEPEENNGAHSGDVSYRDFSVKVGGSAIIIDENGEVIIKGAKGIRLQFTDSMGIYKNGSPEKILLAGPIREILDTMASTINALSARIVALEIDASLPSGGTVGLPATTDAVQSSSITVPL